MNETKNKKEVRAAVPIWLDRKPLTSVLSIIGRLSLCYLFVSAAVFHLTFGRDVTIKDMTAHSIPFAPALNLVAMIISGGLALALLFNVKPRWAALGLALYTLCVSWVLYGPLQANWSNTRIFFMKDMAIFGGLLAWSCALAGQSVRNNSLVG